MHAHGCLLLRSHSKLTILMNKMFLINMISYMSLDSRRSAPAGTLGLLQPDKPRLQKEWRVWNSGPNQWNPGWSRIIASHPRILSLCQCLPLWLVIKAHPSSENSSRSQLTENQGSSFLEKPNLCQGISQNHLLWPQAATWKTWQPKPTSNWKRRWSKTKGNERNWQKGQITVYW